MKLHPPDHDPFRLPSAAVRALAMLWLFKMELSIIAMIGILMLIGIVKNAIMMIDFALDAQRNNGMAPRKRPHRVPAAFPAYLMTTRH